MVRPRTRCRCLFLAPYDYCMILLAAKISQALCEPAILLEQDASPATLDWIERVDPNEVIVLGAELPKSFRQPLRNLRIPAHGLTGPSPQQVGLKAYRRFGPKSGLRPMLTWDQDPIDWPETFPLFFSGDWDALGALRDSKRLLVVQTPFGPLRDGAGIGTALIISDYRYHCSFAAHPFELTSAWTGSVNSQAEAIPFQHQSRYRCPLPLPPLERPGSGVGFLRSGLQGSACWSLSEFADRDLNGLFDHFHSVQYVDADGDGSPDRRQTIDTVQVAGSATDRQARYLDEIWDAQRRFWRARSVTTEFSTAQPHWRRRIVEEDLDGDGQMERRVVSDLQKQAPEMVREPELDKKREKAN